MKLLLLAPALLAVGCLHPRRGEPPSRDVIAFIQEGTTTRADLLLTFGAPACLFEEGRIAISYFTVDDARRCVPSSPSLDLNDRASLGVRMTSHHLVVVFDEHGVVTRSRMVEVQ